MLRFFIIMTLVGIFLCFLSCFHTYLDLKYEREMPFDHLPGLFSYAVYTAEITEMPEEVYPSYYMVKMGDNALMVTQIKKELEKCKEKDPVKVRGVLQYIPEDDTKLRQAALEYFDTHHCYDDSRRLKQFASTHYLDCGWFDYSTILHDKHILGIVFGLTILIVNAMWMHVTGTRFLIRHFRPACGSVRYTPEEIDELANCRESVWYPASGIYVTPKLLIGT